MADLEFRFWGVRGSIPAAGAHVARHGGNTPCLEVRAGGELVIVDMGSGIRALGDALAAGPVQATVLVSHYHYDHIQGLPFFAPIFNPGNRFTIHGPVSEGQHVRDALAGQMVKPYFPVGLEVFRAQVAFEDLLPESTLHLGSLTVKTTALNHPGGSMGFRFERGGKSLCYCTDVEQDRGAGDERVVALARGADWLALDAMYTPEEYPPKRNFGHSTWEFAVDVARKAAVKNLLLCHHDPARSDDGLEAIVATARERFPATGAAREGQLITI